MFIKPYVKEQAKNIGEKFLITILVFLGVFFMVLFMFRAPIKKFEVADLITGETYSLRESEFYFRGNDIIINTIGECQKKIKFSQYSLKKL